MLCSGWHKDILSYNQEHYIDNGAMLSKEKHRKTVWLDSAVATAVSDCPALISKSGWHDAGGDQVLLDQGNVMPWTDPGDRPQQRKHVCTAFSCLTHAFPQGCEVAPHQQTLHHDSCRQQVQQLQGHQSCAHFLPLQQ